MGSVSFQKPMRLSMGASNVIKQKKGTKNLFKNCMSTRLENIIIGVERFYDAQEALIITESW